MCMCGRLMCLALERCQGVCTCKYKHGCVDWGKNPSQQRETLPVLQVPIRLMNIWCGRLDGIMDPLPF